MTRLLAAVEPEACQQIRLHFAIPARPERDAVRHVGEARFDRHLLCLRVESKDAHGARSWLQQIEQALDGRRLARAIASEESVTTPWLHRYVEAVDGVELPVAAA